MKMNFLLIMLITSLIIGGCQQRTSLPTGQATLGLEGKQASLIDNLGVNEDLFVKNIKAIGPASYFKVTNEAIFEKGLRTDQLSPVSSSGIVGLNGDVRVSGKLSVNGAEITTPGKAKGYEYCIVKAGGNRLKSQTGGEIFCDPGETAVGGGCYTNTPNCLMTQSYAVKSPRPGDMPANSGLANGWLCKDGVGVDITAGKPLIASTPCQMYPQVICCK